VIARVVDKRDVAWLARLVTSVSSMALALVLAEDVFHLGLLSGEKALLYPIVGLLIALAGIGPWLVWPRRGFATRVRCEHGVVHLGRMTLRSLEITALSKVRAARGWSVAVLRRKKGVVFLEVESAEDAAQVEEALSTPPPSAAALPSPSRALMAVQLIVSVVALACGPLYWFAATHGGSPFLHLDGKAFFGIGGVVAAQLALVLLLIRQQPRHALGLVRGAWDGHVAMHRGAGNEGSGARDHVDEPAHDRVRVGTLRQGGEHVGAWLARLDALPKELAERHAYRGDAMNKDVLWETLADVGAPVDARMGAARVLLRRYGEAPLELVRVVEDPDVRVRVEAALEEQEDAERAIERLGPIFRAR
jgi:hypothetical protein